MAMPDLDELLQIAASVARSAGELLLDGLHRARTSVRTKSSRTDMVTEMDIASESLIATSLHRQRPGDAIIGEEGARQEGSTGVRWIVDPLDGTTNYLYAWPAFAVSIAAEVDGLVAVGIVHDPLHAEDVRRHPWEAEPGCRTPTLAGRGPDPRRGGVSAARRRRHSPTARRRRRGWATRWSAPASTTTPDCAPVRPRYSPMCCRRCATFAELAPPPSICAGSRPGALTGSFEAGLHPWTGRPAPSSLASRVQWVGDLEGGPPSRSMTLARRPELANHLRSLLLDAGAGSIFPKHRG